MRLTNLLRLALAVLLAWTPIALGDTVAARFAELRLEEDRYVLDADFDLVLNATLEEAVVRGVPLYFVVEFELQRPRWYWFDDTLITNALNYRLSYNALTRQYRLSSGGAFYQTLSTLEEAQRAIERVRGRSVIDKSALFKGTRYEAAVRLRLDTTQLPKPFQISALTSRDWNLQSEWLRWNFTP
ncbi:MAG: DUF4390 domain-containing protein [Betaproteobacteria bacterium]